MSTNNLTSTIIKRTLRVPRTATPLKEEVSANAESVSRQLDVVLMSNGFKASADLLAYVASLHNVDATEVSSEVVSAVKELVGNHVKHNTYFKDFPENVPDTIEFWLGLIEKTYGSLDSAPLFINLLELDGYGKYQHTYEEMVAAHEELKPDPKAKTKLTRIVLGGTLAEEAHKLYLSLAESKVPANEDDRELLKTLAEVCVDDEQPEKIPVRENKAIINAVRVEQKKAVLVDTVTDVLRLAAHLSGGDVTLEKPSKFKNFNVTERRALMYALEAVIQNNPAKLGDVFKHREQFKQLQRKLKISQFTPLKNAQEVFRVARDRENLSFESKVEKAFETGKTKEIAQLLTNNPGLYVRSFNRILLNATVRDLNNVVDTLEKVAPRVSTPVLVSLRQYLNNRTEQKSARVFVNRKGRGKVVEDTQPVLTEKFLEPVNEVIDKEVSSRLKPAVYLVNPDVLDVALPLSNKSTDTGFNTMPRGSVDTLEAEVLRFFTYWKEKNHTTDFDLSAVMYDEDFKQIGQLSYTNLREAGGVHSGDLTESRNGATEFIDIETAKVAAKYVIPQVNVYSGEGFHEVEESFFGYMSRTKAQKGKPYEATTVNTKAELRGTNRVALPLVFTKQDDGTWEVKWLNVFLQGYAWGNATENNAFGAATLVRSIVETEYLTVDYIVNLLRNIMVADETGDTQVIWADEVVYDEFDEDTEFVYVGRETIEGLPEGTKEITLQNLQEIL